MDQVMNPVVPYLFEPSPCVQRLDRLGWAEGMTFETHGLRIGIRTNMPTVLAQLDDYLPAGRGLAPSPEVDWLYSLIVGGESARPGIRRFNLLYSDAMLVARSREFADVLPVLEADLHYLIANAARDRMFVHAGVVGWNGQAIVIPGRSHSGKTTLVEAFLRAGATYYSDEYAAFDDLGRVHPFPRPLGIRHPDTDAHHPTLATEVGAAVGDAPLPVALILLTEYQSGAQWRPRPVSHGRAVLALLSQTFTAQREPAAAVAYLQRAAANAETLKGRRGDADDVVKRVLARLESRRGHVQRMEGGSNDVHSVSPSTA